MTDLVLDENILTWRAKGRVGAVLRDKWRLVRLLGVGGMAAVYEGVHRNGKRGAVKVLHLELSLNPDARSRFLQEGYVANKVDHPGAVSVLDDDVAEDGSVFLVMELLEGRTLDDLARARPGRRIEPGEALALADQLLDVLAAAHDKGIVHRDLKPENLFLTREGRVKVLDFGLARVREAGGARLTKTGNAMGTPAFLPPEQAQGHWDKVDGRTDLWATGATLFTLLTGRLVHEASNVNQILLAAMTHKAPPLRSVAPDVPRPVAAIVDKALSFDTTDRHRDAGAMQRAVREARARMAPVDLVALHDSVPSGEAFSGPTEGAGASLLASSLSRAATMRMPRRSLRRVTLAAACGGAIAAVLVAVALLRPTPGEPEGAVTVSPATQARVATESPGPVAAPVKPAPEPLPDPPTPAPTAEPSVAPAAPSAPAVSRVRPTASPSAKPPQTASRADPFHDFR